MQKPGMIDRNDAREPGQWSVTRAVLVGCAVGALFWAVVAILAFRWLS